MNRAEDHECGNPIVVRLPARVDVSNTREVLDAVRAEVAQGRCIVLDFAATEAVDSTALGAMVQIYKCTREKGGRLYLAGVREGVRRVLAMSHLEHILALVPSVEAALEGRC